VDSIAVFLLGAITTSIPLIIWYCKRIGEKYVAECKATQADLDKILVDLNGLHNSAVQKYSAIEGRLMKVESLIQANNYGKAMK